MRSVLRAVENSVGGWLMSTASASNKDDELGRKTDASRVISKTGNSNMELSCIDNCESSDGLTANPKDKAELDTILIFPLLARYLHSVGLSHFLDDVTNQITCENATRVQLWSIDRLREWLTSLKFLGDYCKASSILESECIDGDCFMQLSDIEWEELELDQTSRTVLKCIRDGWKNAWGSPILVPLDSLAGTVPDVTLPASFKPSNATGSMSAKLRVADRAATSTGVGAVYGQLVTLGYREYRVTGKTWLPMGTSNDKFQLKRRAVANGLRLSRASTVSVRVASGNQRSCKPEDVVRHHRAPDCSHLAAFACSSHEQCVLEYAAEPSRDVFQIGRMQAPQNDLLLRGPLHSDPQGVLCGPVSRYGAVRELVAGGFACRVECERLTPFRSYLFAGGFNEKNEMFLPESSPKWGSRASTVTVGCGSSSGSASGSGSVCLESWDALTTFGVRLWRPDTGCWQEVSILGHVYGPRPQPSLPGPRLDPDPHALAMNQLVDGSIVDINGVLLLFQAPHSAQRRHKVDPHQLLRRLNGLKPQCPVLMHTIRFTYVSPKQRVANAVRRLQSSGDGVVPTGSFHVPPVDNSDVEEDRRPYVFPACGHVHAFSKALEGRPCPLCRQVGPFVPLILPFEATICEGVPTHVFNPCGHAAAKETCEFWASLPPSVALPRQRPICPFCASALENSAHGGPFSKLVLQFERSGSVSSTLDVWREGGADSDSDEVGTEDSPRVCVGSVCEEGEDDVEDVDEDEELRECELRAQQLLIRRQLEPSGMDVGMEEALVAGAAGSGYGARASRGLGHTRGHSRSRRARIVDGDLDAASVGAGAVARRRGEDSRMDTGISAGEGGPRGVGVGGGHVAI